MIIKTSRSVSNVIILRLFILCKIFYYFIHKAWTLHICKLHMDMVKEVWTGACEDRCMVAPWCDV
jgi:hypothetical protein